jgi:type I restriction enzyme M protein
MKKEQMIKKANNLSEPMQKENSNSIFLKNVERGIAKNILSLSADEAKITYHCSREHIESFKDPEEKVRASYFVELILDFQYPANKIDIEVIVPRRTPEDRADIVVYEDEELKKPFIVVECKKDGVTDSEFKQAIEQAFGNSNSLRSTYAVVVAGITITRFDVAGFKPSEREKNVISNIPVKYGKAPKYNYLKNDQENDLKIVSRDELMKALQKSHDTIWQGGKLAPTTAFDEVSKLLFCKLRDEKDTKKGDYYKFQIGTHESAEEVFERINSIYQKAKKEDAEVFKEDIRLDSKVVYNVVEHLQGLAINKIDLDTKGIAFEKFMEDFFKGKMGQFFTPREIIRFCVQMLNPTKEDLVLDPACGSGGFLLNTLDDIRKLAEESYDEIEAKEHWHKFAMNNLYGIEINDQIARVCKMNMIIHDDGHTNVISTDSLTPFNEISQIHKGFKKDSFDLILTNPPFGATIKSTEKDYLENYKLGKDKDNQKTEILFIERCWEFLKPSGRMAIVLPDGILTNSSLQYVRDFIMDKMQILAVISLPQIAFAHFGAGVKSSLVFVRKKRGDENLKDYPIFMALAEHIGYDATGRKDKINDLDKILAEYRKFEKNPKNYGGC